MTKPLFGRREGFDGAFDVGDVREPPRQLAGRETDRYGPLRHLVRRSDLVGKGVEAVIARTLQIGRFRPEADIALGCQPTSSSKGPCNRDYLFDACGPLVRTTFPAAQDR